jgi:hypothetical protein
MASSVGAVLLGWALLGRMDITPVSNAADIVSPQPRVVVVQVPVSNPASIGSQQRVRQSVLPEQTNVQANVQANVQTVPASSASTAAQPRIVMPSKPQKPTFQQPATRTRGS